MAVHSQVPEPVGHHGIRSHHRRACQDSCPRACEGHSIYCAWLPILPADQAAPGEPAEDHELLSGKNRRYPAAGSSGVQGHPFSPRSQSTRSVPFRIGEHEGSRSRHCTTRRAVFRRGSNAVVFTWHEVLWDLPGSLVRITPVADMCRSTDTLLPDAAVFTDPVL